MCSYLLRNKRLSWLQSPNASYASQCTCSLSQNPRVPKNVSPSFWPLTILCFSCIFNYCNSLPPSRCFCFVVFLCGLVLGPSLWLYSFKQSTWFRFSSCSGNLKHVLYKPSTLLFIYSWEEISILLVTLTGPGLSSYYCNKYIQSNFRGCAGST